MHLLEKQNNTKINSTITYKYTKQYYCAEFNKESKHQYSYRKE